MNSIKDVTNGELRFQILDLRCIAHLKTIATLPKKNQAQPLFLLIGRFN